VLALALPAAAQPSGDLRSAVALFQKVRTADNVTYVHANGWEGKLDVYAQRTPQSGAATPVVISQSTATPIRWCHTTIRSGCRMRCRKPASSTSS
jgi:hypothetical protein